jgi:hypothetical protein
MSSRSFAEKHAIPAIIVPSDKKGRKEFLKSESKKLAQQERMSAREIKERFVNGYKLSGFPSERTISGWISNISKTRIESPMWKAWNETPITDDLGFLLRLQLVKRSEVAQMLLASCCEPLEQLHRDFSQKEAEIAVKLQMSLYGLDLLIQFLIIHEYAERLSFPDDPYTQDLDLLIATRPWTGPELYEAEIRSGTTPRVSVKSLNYTNFVSRDTRIHNPDQFFSENEVTRISYRLIVEGQPIIKLQMWIWNTLGVPWNLSINHRDLVTEDKMEIWLKIPVEQKQLDSKRVEFSEEKFNWESLAALGTEVHSPNFWINDEGANDVE